MTSLARTLALLDLFSAEAMIWTAEAMAEELGYSRPTTYRYIRELVATGLLARFGDGTYSLGPRIVELDLIIRQADPLLTAGMPVLQDLVARTGYDVNLIGLYGGRIVTIHQERGSERLPLSFGRGRPMPPFRGAGSKIIVAYLPRAHQKRLYEVNREEAGRHGLGASWDEFRTALARLRYEGSAVSQGELDPGFAGIAVPVFSPDQRILGAIVAALTQQRFALIQHERLTDLLKRGAEETSRALSDLTRPVAAAEPSAEARAS